MELFPVTIREEIPTDHSSIDEVNRLAFAGGEEVGIVHRLREAGLVITSLVASAGGEDIVGHVLFSRLSMETDRGAVDAVALGPVAVRTDFQRCGVGSALIRAGLDICRRRGESVVIVVGHPGYYPRFGFSAALAKNIRSPFSGDAWMALELTPGALRDLTGVVMYPPAWGG